MNYFGNLCYKDTKLIVSIDEGFADFYRSLIPKHIKFKKPFYPAHITVSRNENCSYVSDKIIYFEYSPDIMIDNRYIWINVICDELKEIRKSVGLPETIELSRPPDNSGFFHITIGNFK